ncbi:hypothetical protein Emag_002956 [Eimeria magna]
MVVIIFGDAVVQTVDDGEQCEPAAEALTLHQTETEKTQQIERSRVCTLLQSTFFGDTACTSKMKAIPFRTLLPLPPDCELTATSRPTHIQQGEASLTLSKDSELKYLVARGLKRSLNQWSRDQQQEKLHQRSLKTRRLQHEDGLRILTGGSTGSQDAVEFSSLLSAEGLLCKLRADATACVHTEQHVGEEKTKVAVAARDLLPRVAAVASAVLSLSSAFNEKEREPDLQRIFASAAAVCTLVQLQRHFLDGGSPQARYFLSLVLKSSKAVLHKPLGTFSQIHL